jgi:hypothetical protein
VQGKDESNLRRALELNWTIWTFDMSSDSGDDRQSPPLSPYSDILCWAVLRSPSYLDVLASHEVIDDNFIS